MTFDPKRVTGAQLAEAILAAARQRSAKHAHDWKPVLSGNTALRVFSEKLADCYGCPPELVTALVVEGIMVGCELQQIAEGRRLVI